MHSIPANKVNPPTILYVDYSPGVDSDRRRLDGIRRYAATRDWRVETLNHADCSPAALREALARIRPIGCAAECWCPDTALRPALFGRVPVVYFSPPERPGWRNARGVTCDEAAVARMAFEELSAGNPSSYAVLSCWKKERWARERIETFRECCRKAGANCTVSYFTAKNASECPMRAKLMIPWAAALPPHCAVFTVNDCCARCAAKAIAAAGRSFPRTVTLVGADGAEPTQDREILGEISTVRLDFELAGYLAAKALCAFAAEETSLHCGAAAPSLRRSRHFIAAQPPLHSRRQARTSLRRKPPLHCAASPRHFIRATGAHFIAALAATSFRRLRCP